jgi:serine/threonine protein kinase
MNQIGRYEIVGHTGNHGLGSLYQAFDPVMHRPVMIRIADRSTNPGVSFDQARQAILFDAKQLAHLDHPNIIKFLACEEDDGRPYLVMERFEGKPLSGRLPPERLAAVLKSAALALDHAHSKGLIHRNLTPDSLLLADDGSLKITGFEIARPAQYLNSDDAGQDFDLLLDSIHYMSPELVRGDVLDPRTDQYSLGVIACQALTGALPFRADSPITLLSNIAFAPPEVHGVSISMAQTLGRVLSKSPAARFASSAEFAAAFEDALSQSHPAPSTTLNRIVPPGQVKALIPWILGAIVLAALVIAGALAVTRPRPKPVPVPVIHEVPLPPPPKVVETPQPPVIKPKPKAAKKAATKDTTPEPPKLKPIEPKVVHQ